ncbi:MAG: hypothetical protein QOI57_1804 [Rubrobacteraceae bacterium]|nr:hypothetical protein [Rubrobacteraceae bacterium]
MKSPAKKGWNLVVNVPTPQRSACAEYCAAGSPDGGPTTPW